MLVLPTLVFLLTSYQIYAQSSEQVNEAKRRVHAYLLRTARQDVRDQTAWMQNSGKIGAGFDTVAGSPVCYTGFCQMEGFRRPLFKLNMTKHPEGTCTNKLIPHNVDLDCLPSMQMTASTESLSSLEQLRESTKRGIEVAAGIGVLGNSLSYLHSSETRSMVDTIIQTNSTVYFTQATISWARLSAFAPMLELSDQFRYVIDNMPCCNESDEIIEYIQELVIDHFGLTYVKDLLLGGIAQQKTVISEENRKSLRENGFSNSNGAELKAAAFVFSASVKMAVSEQYDQSKLSTFNKFSQQSSITTLGGAPNIQSLEEWSKTVPSNPTIIKFGIAPILDLLTRRRFPQDLDILLKRNLIRKSQDRYLVNPLFCYKSCSQHGSCIPTGYFGFGQCRCHAGWSGIDCSTITQLPTGLLANVHQNGTCPVGYVAGSYQWGSFSAQSGAQRKIFPACSLVNENTTMGPRGTFCGIAYFSWFILCDNRHPTVEPCPSGYSKYYWVTTGDYPTTMWLCQKTTPDASDLPGTLCGLHSTQDPGKEVTCNGYHPGRGRCPPNYTFRQGQTSNELGPAIISLCYKD